MIKNPHRLTRYTCASIIVIGILLIFLPGIIGLDGLRGGFALSFFGIFVAILGIITVVIFARLSRLFDRIFQKDNILAHWTYTAEEWKTYTEEEHAEDKSDKRSLFFLVAVISIVAGIILAVIYRDDFMVIIYTVIGIIAVIGLTAFLSVVMPYRWNRHHQGEVYIAREGAYLNSRLHIWKGLGTRLGKVTYEKGKRSLPRIRINYSSYNFAAGNYYTVRIPVPQGKEVAARKIVDAILAAK
jgi:hypothetical protein